MRAASHPLRSKGTSAIWPLRVLDQLLDTKGNAVRLISVRLRVKNVAIKQGHIDRAEFVPLTIQSLPRIDVQGTERSLRWRETQTVEVRALFTEPSSAPNAEQKGFDVEVRLFDNVGRQVGRYVDGLRARMVVRVSRGGK